MITHYDIKMEMQKLKEVLSVEGVNTERSPHNFPKA